jgi:hypothetical protein
MTDWSKPPRKHWGDFPEVLIHASETAVKQHPDCKAAKSGDGLSAVALVNDTMSKACNMALLAMLRGHLPTLVSAHAYERDIVNAIPETFAVELSKSLGWPADWNITQVNVVSHTGADGFSRLAR